jgi:exodeoxyribonuclease III
MKIVSWNVNGIRSIFKTTFREWLRATDPDIVCIQETKCDWIELDEEYTQLDGYYAYFSSSSRRKGHSGVVVYTKVKPLAVETKLGIERFDEEGRCLKLVFDDLTLFNFYIPHGSRDPDDMSYKLGVYRQLIPLLRTLSGKNTVLAGDFNIAHTELDLVHAKTNQDNLMFTPAERAQIGMLLEAGYVDTFRHIYPDTRSYTMWMYGAGFRENDIGWRIDYIFVSKPLQDAIADAFTQRETLGSDHGPLGVVLDKALEPGEPPVHVKRESQTTLF